MTPIRRPWKHTVCARIFFAFLLGHAAQHSKLLALFLQLLVVVQPVEDLLLGFITDGAGVVEDQAGFLYSLDLAVAFRDERAYDFFRVVRVHLAAKGFQVEGLGRLTRHSVSIIPRPLKQFYLRSMARRRGQTRIATDHRRTELFGEYDIRCIISRQIIAQPPNTWQ